MAEYINCKHGTTIICDVCNPPKAAYLPLPLPASDDITARKHKGHRNSVAANDSLAPHKVSQKMKILQWLSIQPGTSEEAWLAGVVTLKSATARFSDLKNEALIYETGVYHKTTSKEDASVCAPTEAGLVLLRQKGLM